MQTFVRQLNLYDFQKQKQAENTQIHEYKHPFFLRDRRNLLNQVLRKTNKNHPGKSLLGKRRNNGQIEDEEQIDSTRINCETANTSSFTA